MNTPIINPASLTEEQREAIKNQYQFCKGRIDYDPLEGSSPYNLIYEGRIGLLNWLFGEDFFKGENNE